MAPKSLLAFSLAAVSLALVAACTGNRGDTDSAVAAAEAEAILDAAERAVGRTPNEDLLQLRADAVVAGPADTFRTMIRSSSDGRVWMQQTPGGFLAGVGQSGGWSVDPETGEVGPLGPASQFVLGHELHMLALSPRSRAAGARYLGPAKLDSLDVLGVSFSLPSGDSLVVYYQPSDTLPVGLRVTWTDPDVLVSWSNWTDAGSLRLFRNAEFRQGSDVFRYRFTEMFVGGLPDSVFEAPVLR